MNQNLTFNKQKLPNPLEFVGAKHCVKNVFRMKFDVENTQGITYILSFLTPKGKGSNMHFEITNKIASIKSFNSLIKYISVYALVIQLHWFVLH